MGVRFRGKVITTQSATEYKCEIWDTAYSSTVTNIELSGDGFELEYQQQGDERYAPIKGSTLRLYTMVTNDAAGTALSSWIQGTLLSNKEDQFHIAIYKDNALDWFGVIIPDVGTTRNDASKPYVVILTATDGIARLKDFDTPIVVTAISTPTSRQTFIQLIYDILKLTPLYKATTETLLFSTCVDWYEDQHPAKANTVDPLDNTMVSPLAYAKLGEDKQYTSMSAYDVLASICEQWNMRCMLSGGIFRFYQIANYEDDAITKYERYWLRSSGGFDSASTFSRYQRTLSNTGYPCVMSGNQWQHYAALKYVLLKYPFANPNMLDELATMSQVSAHSEYYYSATLRDNILGGTGKRLNFATSLRLDIYLPIAGWKFQMWIQIKIKLGSKYLSKPLFAAGASWTTNSADRYEILIQNIDNGESHHAIQIQTPDIPAGSYSSNEFEIKVAGVNENTVNYLLVPATDYFVSRDVGATSLTYSNAATGSEAAYFEYIAGNTSSLINSYDLELSDALVGEPADPTNNGNLYVYNGSSWVLSSSQWRLHDTGSTFDFNMIRVREVLTGQTLPVKKYQGAIIGAVLNGHDSFTYDGDLYILNGGTFKGQSETWDGEWFVIAYQRPDFHEISGATPIYGNNPESMLMRNIGSLAERVNITSDMMVRAMAYIQQVSSDTTLLPLNQTIEATASADITMPDPVDMVIYGRSCEITVLNTGGGTVNILNSDGSTYEATGFHGIVIQSNGTNLITKSKY